MDLQGALGMIGSQAGIWIDYSVSARFRQPMRGKNLLALASKVTDMLTRRPKQATPPPCSHTATRDGLLPSERYPSERFGGGGVAHQCSDKVRCGRHMPLASCRLVGASGFWTQRYELTGDMHDG